MAERSSGRLRELADLPDNVAMGAGAVGLFLSLIYPPAFGPSMQLIIGGGVGKGITNGVWPKKHKER